MAINDEVFYLYGTLDPKGFLKELKGRGLGELGLGQNAPGNYDVSLTDLVKAHSLHAIDISSINEAVEKAAAGQTVSINAELLTPGTVSPGVEMPRRLKLTFMPVMGNKGARDISFVALDVTDYLEEIKFYKDRSEQLYFAAETAGIGLFFWHLNKNEIFTTPRFNELYGLPADEVMTREKFARVIHPDDLKLVNDTILRSHSDFGECNTEYRVMLDGKIRWIWIRGKTFPGTESSPAFTMGSGRDITEWKDSDQAVTKLLRSEQQARDGVEQANRAKDHFIAMVSHELRAPLNSILGWVKILLTKNVDEETRMNALETIERSARVQAKLIGDLVDSSKIISGKLSLEFHPVSLRDAMAYVVESQKPAAQAKNIQLSYLAVAETIKVNADLGRLQQIFTNLLANAIKFTPDGGKIRVVIEENGNNVRVSVEDTGKGIGAEELPHIFESYFQGRVGESTDKSGLGLGLSIVSSLVRQHGGTVLAESRGAGCGAKFVVTLPILAVAGDVKESRVDDDRPELSEEPLEKLRILLVEDNDDSREVLQIFFEQRGAEVAAMSSVAEAMKDIHSNKDLPDVIVSDISMPDEDGYSLIRKIRSLPAKKGGNIPAIALTALVSRDDAKNLLASGFQFHHPKPFESERLIKEILEAVK